MTTVTIPASLAERSDLVAVPRDEYERFIAWQKQIKSAKTFIPTTSDKKALGQARKNRLRRNQITLDELRRTVETSR